MFIVYCRYLKYCRYSGILQASTRPEAATARPQRITGSARKLTLVNEVRWTLHKLVTSSGEKGVGSGEGSGKCRSLVNHPADYRKRQEDNFS